MVEDSEIIVLGGLISDDVQESERKVPLLGDIPLLGRLFKSTTTSRSKKFSCLFETNYCSRCNRHANDYK